MFQPGWLILGILHLSFEVERPKVHWSEVVVHLYMYIQVEDVNKDQIFFLFGVLRPAKHISDNEATAS